MSDDELTELGRLITLVGFVGAVAVGAGLAAVLGVGWAVADRLAARRRR